MSDIRTVRYRFSFENGSSWDYELSFDEEGVLLQADRGASGAKWTDLEFYQCPNCSVKSSDSEHCPVAFNLHPVVQDSKESVSFDRVVVEIETPERVYKKECAKQEALFSIFGLIMASSACPVLDWMRPLARFHLPFASVEETHFRVLALELIGQYFSEPEMTLKGAVDLIEEKYKEISKVNQAFIKRIRAYCDGDADKNAIASLDCLAQLFEFQADAGFGSLKRYFQ